MNVVRTLMSISGCVLLCLSMQARPEAAISEEVKAQENAQKKLKEVRRKKEETSKKRSALTQQLSQAIKECNSRGLELSKELGVLVQELICLEHVSNKKRTGEQIKEAREKLAAAKKQFTLAAGSEEFALAVKELENTLIHEDQLAAEEASIAGANYLLPDCKRDSSAFYSFLKPAVAFASGAAVIALLHWRKIITIPQA